MSKLGRGLVSIGALAVVAMLAVAVTVQAAPRRAPSRASTSVTVFAAASLKEAFTQLGATFGAQNHAAVTFSFGGSDMLATQILQGAPADVFASANMAQMTLVQQHGDLASAPVIFVRNRLMVIVPKSNPGHVYSLPDLGRPGLKLVLAAPAVPVGKYARAAFTVMASDAAFGPDFLARVEKNVVSNETDVKAVVSKVLLGEADAGVVYLTDVTPQVAPRVQEIAIPPAYNQIATYPIAVVKGSHNAALAQKFVEYVRSPGGQAVLKAHNFLSATPSPSYYAPRVEVTGLVSQTLSLGVAELKRMPATTVKVTMRSDKGSLGTHRFTGALLDGVIQAALPISNTSFKNDALRQFVTVGATDGYQVSVSMAEILPQFGHEQVLLAYVEDGKPLARADGAVELIVPGDTLAGRDVRNVNQIIVGTPLGNW